MLFAGSRSLCCSPACSSTSAVATPAPWRRRTCMLVVWSPALPSTSSSFILTWWPSCTWAWRCASPAVRSSTAKRWSCRARPWARRRSARRWICSRTTSIASTWRQYFCTICGSAHSRPSSWCTSCTTRCRSRRSSASPRSWCSYRCRAFSANGPHRWGWRPPSGQTSELG